MSGRQNFRVTTTQDGRRQFGGQRDDGNSGGSYSSGVYTHKGNRGSFNKGRARRGGRFDSNRINSATVRQFLDRDEDMGGDGGSSSAASSASGQLGNRGYNPRRGGGRGRHSRGYMGRNQPRILRSPGNYNSSSQQNPERGDWYKVTIINGKNLEGDFVLKSIANLSDIQFVPVMYSTERNDAVFFVRGYEASKAIQKTSRKVATPPSGSLMLVQVTRWSGRPPVVMSPEVINKITIVMGTRYDAATSSLNLHNMFNDTDLVGEGIYLSLGKTHIIKDIFDIIGTNIPQLTGLDLSKNYISNPQCLTTLPEKAPNLTRLNLSHNMLSHERDLKNIEKLALVELHLKGNQLCDRFRDTQTYISSLRKIFPKLLKLDEHELPPPIIIEIETPTTLPATKGNHFVNDSIKNLICCFVEQYFACYDNANRPALLAAYHDQATFSLCTYHKVPQKKRSVFEAYNSNCRNFKHCGTASRQNSLKRGPQEIINLLDSLPATQHDPMSFVVDVNLTAPTMLIFVINGVFREKSSSSSNNGPIRQFSRTFVTVPNGDGIAIVNDMLTITNASEERAKKSFSPATAAAGGPVPGPSSSAVVTDGPALTQDVQLQMIKQMSIQTNMNEEWSAKCLAQCNWDYNKALLAFREAQANNGVPPEAFVR